LHTNAQGDLHHYIPTLRVWYNARPGYRKRPSVDGPPFD
jgi:hypothetical protein